MNPSKGSKVKGVIHFEKLDDHKMKISGVITGLKANSKFGFHIHQKGDCSSDDGKSAGGHFNPKEKSHGGPESKDRHVGDLGNLQSNEKGVAHYDMVFEHMSLGHPGYGIAGRAVIIHADEDDLKSQPTGNAGARKACGVIGVVE